MYDRYREMGRGGRSHAGHFGSGNQTSGSAEVGQFARRGDPPERQFSHSRGTSLSNRVSLLTAREVLIHTKHYL